MELLNQISQNLQCGKAKVVKQLVQQAIDEGIPVQQILNEGLLDGMNVVGEKFKNNEVFVPEVLVAARAMNMGTQLLKPLMAQEGVEAIGKVCIGTVKGDLHDIGKNLVKMMMEGKGFEVVDLGTDVAPETFVQTAIDQGCQIICCSALLTTTMGTMGASQGGGLTLACASLVPQIKRVAPQYPFLSDYKRVWQIDLDVDAYRELRDYFRIFDPRHEREQEIFEKLGYIDIQNMTKWIRGTVLMATGLLDTICPPSTQFAAYNKITAPKSVVFYPDYGHEWLPDHDDAVFQFMAELKK